MPSLSIIQVELLFEPHIAQFVTLMENGSHKYPRVARH